MHSNLKIIALICHLHICFSNAQNLLESLIELQKLNEASVPQVSQQCSGKKITITDENGDTICKCDQGDLYYPPLDDCFEAYSRGPCTSSHYFILPPKSAGAKCVKNPCDEGYAVYRGICYKLYASGYPCEEDQILSVNPETYEIICQDTVQSRYIIEAPRVTVSPSI